MLIQQGSKLFESVSNLCFQYRWLFNRASSGMYKTCCHRDVEYHPQVFNPISALNECLVLSGCIDLWQLHPICLGWNPGSNILMHQKTQIWNENCQNCSPKKNLDKFQTNKKPWKNPHKMMSLWLQQSQKLAWGSFNSFPPQGHHGRLITCGVGGGDSTGLRAEMVDS